MKHRPHRWFTPLLLSAVGLGLSAPASAEVLKWGAKQDLYSLDPYSYGSSATLAGLNHVYEGLVRYSTDLQIEPALATDWELLDDRTWRFTLRQGVTFHNGNPFNADDVIASLERVSHDTSPLKGNLPAYAGSAKVDDHTVDITLNGPYPLLLNDLTNIYIMDKEWMEEHDSLLPTSVSDGREGHATTHTNGTGPFMVTERRPDALTRMVVNPDWWDEARHNLDGIDLLPIASDATRVAALLSGEIHFTDVSPLQDADRINRTGGVRTLEGPSLRTVFLGFNYRDQLNSSNLEGVNPFQDPRVRKAMYQAIDIELLAARVMRGKARIAGALVAPEIPGYRDELNERFPHDPEAARALLAEAGYPDDFSFAMDCSNDNYVNDAEICQAVAAMWTRIGLSPELTLLPSSQYAPHYQNGNSDIYILGWATLPMLDAYSLLVQVLHTKTGTAGVFNVGGYSNPELDALIQQSGTELDNDARLALMGEALGIAREDIFALPLHQQPLSWAVSANLEMPQAADNKPRLWHARFTD